VKNIIKASVSILLVACASETGTLTISDPWARPGQAGGNSAVYMTIQNPIPVEDRLLSASSDVAEDVEIHETAMTGDVMQMAPQDHVSIPANGGVELLPGGMHIMLIGLERDLAAGDEFTLTLEFENAGIVTALIKTRGP